MSHVNKGGACEHDGLKQDETDFPEASIRAVDGREEVMQIQKGHVRVDKLNVRPYHLVP